mmetsp:Transcript_6003/g.8908  ORF Transcript_6003/g.8908 Transcript_6003/m.8908 type:complete len:86 (-) Transcript_6003:231-488(-)
MSSIIETLVENAKYMPQGDENEPSACEVKCQTQQSALVDCMNSIRDKQESGSAEDNKHPNACLAPSVASWTACCSAANLSSPPEF